MSLGLSSGKGTENCSSKLRVAADDANDFLYQVVARYSTRSCTVEMFARRLSVLWFVKCKRWSVCAKNFACRRAVGRGRDRFDLEDPVSSKAGNCLQVFLEIEIGVKCNTEKFGKGRGLDFLTVNF